MLNPVALQVWVAAVVVTQVGLVSALNSPDVDDISREAVFHTVRRFTVEHEGLVRESINLFTEDTRFSKNEEFMTQMKALTGLLPGLQVTDIVQPLITDCQACTILIKGLQFLLSRQSYEEMEPMFIQVCMWVYTDVPVIGGKRSEICHGSVTTQGPHVAFVVNRTSADRVCAFQNACPMPPGSLGIKISSPAEQKKSPIGNNSQIKKLSSSEQNVLKVVQLTDIHVDTRFEEGSIADCGLPICCLRKYGQGDASRWGDYHCNIPPRTVELFLRKIAADIQPDFLLYSGDISGSRVWDESQEEVLNCTASVVRLLNETLHGFRTFPCLGNHEMFPTNLYYQGLPDNVDLMNQLTEWWAPIANFTDEQKTTMKLAGYYSALVQPGLRVLTYNSNFMYTNNWYNVINYDERSEAEDMIVFIESELSRARANQEKVIFVGHHPTNSGDYIRELAQWYKKLVLEYADVIVLQVAGHRHSDEFHLISDEAGVKSIMYLAGPVTTGGTKNPSIRVYHLDATTFELIDYHQYYLDFKTLNITDSNDPTIELLYSAKTEYGLSDLSPQSWSDFTDRMENDTEMLLRHYNHAFINSRGYLECDERCSISHLCRLRHCIYNEYLDCVNPTTSNSTNPTDTTQHTSSQPGPPATSSASHFKSSHAYFLLIAVVFLYSAFATFP